MPRFGVLLLLVCSTVGCGGDATSPQSPSGATSTPDPQSSLPAGPVAEVRLGIHYIDFNHQVSPGEDLRDAYTQGTCGPSGQPCWILFPGEFVQLDADQTNAQGQECQWVRDPVWTNENSGGAISVRGSSRPFQFRFDAVKPGDAAIRVMVDGVPSNELWVRVSSGPKPY